MSTLRPLLAVPIVLLVAACSAAAAPSPSASPGGSPTVSPSPSPTDAGEALEHPTGATDVILRMSQGGGFVPIGWAATEGPSFTLFGDGTVVTRDELAPFPDPGPSGLILAAPFFTATMPSDQVDGLLRFALTEGGLGTARARYENGMIADAPTTTFTVNAGGVEKTVEVYALGIAADGDPDAPIKAAFVGLMERLQAIATELPATGEVYQPDRWRGALIEAEAGQVQDPIDWPWPDIDPSDFVADDAIGRGFPSRVMSLEELEVLGLGDLAGGIQNIGLTAPDGGKLFQLAIRPLLADEVG
jgi:hypothetical protein